MRLPKVQKDAAAVIVDPASQSPFSDLARPRQDDGLSTRISIFSQLKRSRVATYSRVVKRTSMTIDTGCSEELKVRRASMNVLASSCALDTTLHGIRKLSSNWGST